MHLRNTFLVFALGLVLGQGSLALSQESPFGTPNSPPELGLLSYEGDVFILTRRVPVAETREVAYTVTVPVEVAENGRTRTEMRQETRTRTIIVTLYAAEQIEVARDAVTFSSVSGKRPDNIDQVIRLLAKPKPVIVTYEKELLGDYYKQLFLPGALVMHIEPGDNQVPAPAFAVPEPAPAPESGVLPPAPVIDPSN